MSGSLQDSYLNQIRRENHVVNIYLVNGVHFQCKIIGFDSFVILVERDGKHDLVYKHAVSTLVPINQFRLNLENEPSKVLKNNIQNKNDKNNKVDKISTPIT